MKATELLWRQAERFGPLHVVDVGANPIEGDAPYKALLEAGCLDLTGFEPQPEALAALNARKSARETYHPQALGAGGAADFHLYAHSGFASLYPVRAEVAGMLGFARATHLRSVERVATARLDDLAGLGPVDYLKIDAQGVEMDVISSGSGKLARAVLIQTEVRFLPLYDGEPGFAALDAELRRQGFQFHDFAFLKRVPLSSSRQGRLRRAVLRQVVDGDAFYVRDLTTIAAWSESQILRLALLAHSVVASPALVLFCLEALAARGVVPEGIADEYLGLVPANWLRAS